MSRDREIWSFLVTIVVANTLFIAALAAGWLPMQLYSKGRFLLLGLLLAVIVWAWRGRQGIVALLRPMTVWRIGAKWFLLAIAWAASLATLTLVGKGLLTGTGFAEVRTDFSVILHPSVLVTVLLAAFIGEIVWVSYAIGRLSQHTTVFVASLIVGVFWSLWWTPIVLIGIGVIPGLPLTALFINMLGVAAMCGFVYSHTRSGLAVLCLQLGLNSSMLIFPVSPTTGGVETYWAFGIVYTVAAVLMFALFGPRPLFGAGQRSGYSTESARA